VLQLDRTWGGLWGNGFPILFRRLQERLQLFFRDTDATLPLADPIATEPAVAKHITMVKEAPVGHSWQE
jgi:hypothetical protein